MSSSTAIKVKKISKDKQAEPTDPKNDDLHNSYDSRESVEDAESKDVSKPKSTKKGTKKGSQTKEQETKSPEVGKESQGEPEATKTEEQKIVEQDAVEGKAAKKGKKAKKGDDKTAEIVPHSDHVNTEAQKKKEVKKTEGDEAKEIESKLKKVGVKLETVPAKKTELVVQADLTANKPKPATEIKSPNPKAKEPTGPVKTEPQKIISLSDLKKNEKNVPPPKQNPTSETLPSHRADAENKKVATNQKPLQSPKNPPIIDLSAVKFAAPQTTTSPKPVIEKPKTAIQRPAEVETKFVEGSSAKTAADKASPKNALKEVSQPGKDVKSPRNAKAPGAKEIIETKKAEENAKSLSRKPTAALEKQKTIPQNDKSVNVKGNTKPEKSQGGRVNTEGAERIKPASATYRTAKSPQTVRQTESAAKNPDYFSPRLQDKNKANKGEKSEKARMRSFDAGKTDKISAEDPFDVRNKMWQIRKQEKLLEEEKKKMKRDTQECTFSPRLNQNSLSKQLSPYDIYERGVEWNEKVQHALTDKREKRFEEMRQPNISKSRVKSGSFVPEPRKSQATLEGWTGPQFGTSRNMNVPAYSQEPLEYKTNLENQITEIRDMFDHIASTLKAKNAKNSHRGPEQQNTPRTQTEDHIKLEKVSSPQTRSTFAKSPALENQKEDAHRIDSLKGILNLKHDAKKLKAKEQPKKVSVDEGTDFFIGGDMAKNPRQIEIRNNRYVMIDTNNLSGIEKKDTVDSNDVSLNFEGTETK